MGGVIRNMDLKMRLPVDQVLAALRRNRKRHAQIVQEARAGYVEAAERALKRKLAEIAEGRMVALHFTLQPPRDMTSAYDTVIGMLEMTSEKELTLTAAEFRQFVQDEWDWAVDFLTANAAYSATARAMHPGDVE